MHSTIRDKYGLTQTEVIDNHNPSVRFDGFEGSHVVMDVEKVCSLTVGVLESYCTLIWCEGIKEMMKNLKSDYRVVKECIKN